MARDGAEYFTAPAGAAQRRYETLRAYHPALIDAGFAGLEVPIPWWDGRTLRFRSRRGDHRAAPNLNSII